MPKWLDRILPRLAVEATGHDAPALADVVPSELDAPTAGDQRERVGV
jgi:hypothetical protein